MAKPSVCIHLRWATVSVNAGLAQFFLFCRVEKGLKKATGSGRGICFAKEGGQERSFAKTLSSSSSDQTMSAELGFVTHRASDSPIQALQPRKWSGHPTTEHAECASLFALFWSAATGRGTASITHAGLKTRSDLNVHPQDRCVQGINTHWLFSHRSNIQYLENNSLWVKDQHVKLDNVPFTQHSNILETYTQCSAFLWYKSKWFSSHDFCGILQCSSLHYFPFRNGLLAK